MTPPFPISATRPSIVKFGALSLRSRYTVAPLAGYTNLAFRLAVRGIGPLGLATTDLVNAHALLIRSRKTMALIQTRPEDFPLAVQIYGANPAEMCEAARWLESYGVASIDINMGCPVHKVTRGGGGSAMMCDTTGSTVALVRAVVESVKIPVTVKMRLGWDDDQLTAPWFAREFEKAGIAGLTIHGRTRAQGFSGQVKLEGIRRVVEAIERIPVLGNGDVRTINDAERMLRETGCAGIAIGRGALLNPWFFGQLERWERNGDPGQCATYAERLSFMGRHFRYLVEFQTERFACLSFRKIANWYCRVLKPGRDIQQQLVMIDSLKHFEELEAAIADIIAERGADTMPDAELPIKVPSGPQERW
ncbi:MAG: tRNA dihydrouridine synthase DusB [Planctomycetia bacterium]|nr:tRNA dihydrouridine synthase DusB [Planctomycetia bacterium]